MGDSIRHSSFVIRHLVLACALLLPLEVAAQNPLEYGGSYEQSAQFYARRPNPSDTRSAIAGRFHLWSRATLTPHFSWRGSLDFRLDTHHDVDRRRWADLSQRGLRQPAGALGEFYLDAKLGRLDLRAGKQEIRWGRADGFNPTDNLIPYEYIYTFSDQRIAVPALKADVYLGRARLEAAWIPFFTPTRLPLLNQRWFPELPSTAVVPSGPTGTPVEARLLYREGLAALPGRTLGNGQWALRWNQSVPRAEFSVSYFDGFDDIAFFRATATLFPDAASPLPRFLVSLNRDYYRLRSVGADFASELGPFGIRGELAYFDRTDPANRDHLLFIAGLDRSWGDWFLIVQYTGQKVSGKLENSAVFPDLGLRSTALFRLERNLGPSRSAEIRGAIRLRDGDLLLQPNYTVALTNRWRVKLGATVFAGPADGFLGQYRESSHLNLELRYTF
jgi:hypothetical protein